MRRIGDHAVVLGASLAGLLAARVLADAYGQVTVVERDPLPDRAEHRKGVPQGRHAHVLLARGAQILDELFPGLLDDLAAGGAAVIRELGEVRFSPGGHRLRLQGHPLVLDATGRSGRATGWLATIGYDLPPQEQLRFT